jgi:hypothetical protein
LHVPCFLVGAAGMLCVAFSVWEPLSFNLVKLQ